MKTDVKVIVILLLGFIFLANESAAQWNNSGNNYTTGNLGIGTYTPANRLEVFGSTFNRVSAIVNADVQNGFQLKKNGTNATDWEMYNPSGSTDLRFYNSNFGDILNLRNDGTVLANNAIGIGPVPSMASRLNIEAATGGEQIRMSRGTGVVRFAQDYNKDALYLFNGNASQTYMCWKENGYVGVGTQNPDSKLTVKGTIHAEEVRVDLSVPGPDYVFEENYHLQPLHETKAFIKQNKHLPEVPSARELEENGILVGEMNMLLLKKVEELTLHLIRQQEEIDALKKELHKP